MDRCFLTCAHNFKLGEQFRDKLIAEHGSTYFTKKCASEFIDKSLPSDWNRIKIDPETLRKLNDIKDMKVAVKINNVPPSQIHEILVHTCAHLVTDVKSSTIENPETFVFGLRFDSYI